MIGGRLLLTLVVLTAMLAVRQPTLVEPIKAAPAAERTTWVQRLGAGVTRSFGRIGLMQRVTLRVPSPTVVSPTGHSTRSFASPTPDPLRTCLPPPTV